ncbi:putative membrane-associated Zn-dependent protease [Mycolicibacterium phlei]|jgi:membrane-associated protease RseP (regulator of RpoE activity)|uniref:Zinc metalloprotease Rip1 n=1 Tax=Mycolicibacterium phlei DSM 43239 = CCUG 21000 TaxID=1226750 RepID=A0A5N5UZ15_MYCPH|nr:M50 family metallopeptidase [Mycolicibacterium phlei]VEG09141.1 putative membrane-associated Zn-dependent protease [Mycobacteroides chelonae]AMO61025.1 Zinc metalloprotease Rip1 [Mycolicibacterium phlei]EID14794.1 metallopeptidase MEROPS family protein [Mycolicibacterium phlei RIVM601174]KAB7754844.1 zinc metalloprotease [Mycolicibacterium phlei DSM 43239 = CCUG 21000]KXW64424.1 zinc metalloprotease [Mycolicibacterium phlei DSM 43239 = CCUG 21000]
MMWFLGVVLFALAILVSVALHECGHMWVARATGMKVRRYFVGFGPTLWSTWRSNKQGDRTEYGVKAVPLGGFCDIAGMTAVEELAPDEHDRAMYKQKTWKRTAVLAAGPGMNFVIGLVLIYVIAVVWGLPNLHPPTTAIVGETSCVKSEVTQGELGDCLAPSPAAAAGIEAGDVVVKVGDTPVSTFEEMVAAVRKLDGPTPFTVERDGEEFTTVVGVVPAQRYVGEGESAEPVTVGTVGITAAQIGPTHYNALTAVPATFAFTGDLAVELGKALAKIPAKMGALVRSIGGEERDPETPISVVGASIIGGDAVDQGLWVAFWFFLAQLNFVLGAVNLIPLLPFDGGHIAIAVYEKIRNMIRSARGMVAAGPVNYLKLMPATYVVLVVVVGYMLVTVTADFINPIRPFQ